MTRHRTSAFEENMLVFFKNRGQDYFRTEALPRGYRSTWDDRGRLAVAKLAEKIDATTRPEDFPAILLTNGATSAEDNFIELHLFGDWTVRTISAVVFNNPKPAGMNRTQLRALKHDLTQANVTCQ